MADFQFIQNPLSKKWVVLSPRRAKRPNIAEGLEPVCPFCPDCLKEEIIYHLDGVRVVKNKYPFADIHEVIIHSDDHNKNFDKLELTQTERVLRVYKNRFNTHKSKGQVYIFHNRGEAGGESLPHPHSQLAVIPEKVKIDIPRLATESELKSVVNNKKTYEARHFTVFCPKSSQWPDEFWIAPKKRGKEYGDIDDAEISDLAYVLSRLIHIFDIRHDGDFPFNFYIYPGGDWYLRVVPRLKTLGGFEMGTGVYINTQDSRETMRFIKDNFDNPDKEKIHKHHRAEYHKSV